MIAKDGTTETTENVDIREHGRQNGESISLDARLFIQILVFTGVHDTTPLTEALTAANIQGVLYADINDPYSVGLLAYSEDPNYFVETLRPVLTTEPFTTLTPRPDMTMFGRTYTIGYESDLQHVLVDRPIHRLHQKNWPWAVWYPIRRSGLFEQLPGDEQRTILMEHGTIGHAYGSADHAHDIRLACHGMGTHDNDFIAGLVGKDLYPLSKLVQRMRKTKQTSLYLEQLGPFFIGKVIWRAKVK